MTDLHHLKGDQCIIFSGSCLKHGPCLNLVCHIQFLAVSFLSLFRCYISCRHVEVSLFSSELGIVTHISDNPNQICSYKLIIWIGLCRHIFPQFLRQPDEVVETTAALHQTQIVLQNQAD